MGKFLKFGLSFLIGLAVFLIVLMKIGREAVLRALGLFFSLEGLAVLLITFLLILISTIKWRLILKHQEEQFTTKQLLPLALIGTAMCYLTPFAVFGGEIFRIYFLNKKHPKLSQEKAFSSVAIDRLLEITMFFVFLIIGLLAFGLFGKVMSSPISLASLGFAGFFLGLLLVFYFKNWQKKSALKWLLKIVGVKRIDQNGEMILRAEKDVFRFFSLKNKALWQGFGLAFFEYFLQLLRAFVLIFFLTGHFALIKSLAVYGFACLASLTPLPATLGALELSQGFAFKTLGFGFYQGAVFSMVWRASDLLFSFIGLFFFAKYSASLAQEKLLNFFGKEN